MVVAVKGLVAGSSLHLSVCFSPILPSSPDISCQLPSASSSRYFSSRTVTSHAPPANFKRLVGDIISRVSDQHHRSRAHYISPSSPVQNARPSCRSPPPPSSSPPCQRELAVPVQLTCQRGEGLHVHSRSQGSLPKRLQPRYKPTPLS